MLSFDGGTFGRYETTKHAQGAKVITGNILFKEQGLRINLGHDPTIEQEGFGKQRLSRVSLFQ